MDPFLLKVGSKELNYAATENLKSGRRCKKGVLMTGHTCTTFSGECPRAGPQSSSKLKLSNQGHVIKILLPKLLLAHIYQFRIVTIL